MNDDGEASRRLDLLMAAGELVDRGAPLAEVMTRVLDLVVPAAADFCFVAEGDAMRLTGVRGAFAGAAELEAELRTAGHAAPPPDQPVLIDGPERVGEDLAALARAGIRQVVLAPLRARGRITGSVALGVGPSGRTYGPEDLRFVGVLAGRLGLTLDNARLVATERQLAALVASMEDAVSVRDAGGELVLANRASLDLLGVQSLKELRSLSLGQLRERFALYTADGRPLSDDELGFVRALETGTTPEPLLFRRVTRATGRQQWLRAKTTIVGGADEPPLVMTITEDVTAAKRSEIGQRLLVEAGRVLSQSSAGDDVLQQIADLAVPTLADWCGIELPGPGGQMRLAATAHADPAKLRLAERLRERRPVRVDDEGIAAGVLRTGTSVRLEISPAMLEASADDEEHLELLRAAGLSSLLCAPLQSGGDTLGVLTLIASQPERRFDHVDQDLAEALGRRVGDALRNARLLHDRSEIATVLSSGLRPDEAPELPGCAVAAVYRPAGEGTEAGGDFYDVIDAPGAPIVVMGDVVGKGAPAAALSAVARVTLHTAGRLTAEPRAALDELNNALRRRGGMSLTTVVAVAMPTELPGTAHVLLAGHPPPLLWRDGEVRQVGRHGPMLGAVEVADWPSVPVALAPGDLLVLYTDGVIDAVLPGGERFGEERLALLVAASRGKAEALIAGLERELAGMWLRDDVALMGIHCSAQPALLARATLGPDEHVEPLIALTIPGGPAAPGEARRALTQALTGRVPSEAQGDALIVVSELVTNAVRHGGARAASDAVSVHAALTAEGVRIEVTDPGAGFEPGGHGPRADGGYGLHLLDRLATRWGVAGAEPVTVWVELAR
jgi:PAS domain S-box-containing protein